MTASKTTSPMAAYNVAPFKPYVKPPFPHAHLPMLVPSPGTLDTALLYNLYRALRSRRASDSMSEAKYVAWLCNRLPVTMIDNAGNIHVDMRTTPAHRTMFTSHTDTVHRQGGTNSIRLDASNPKSVKWRADEGHALGADDGAGIVLMQHLIASGVPAYYIFFREEESGGVGSSWLAQNMPDVCDEIDRCISFDRADYADVITHQAGGRCCSDAFADALAAALTRDDMSLAFLPDDTGVFTDSANLTDLIGECTNVSVGYKHQHGDGEWQDITFLELLADQLARVQWDALPTERKPGERDDWGSTFTKYTQPQSSPRHSVDKPTEYLIDALYSAEDEDFAPLRGIVSEWLSPEQPELALRLIDPRRINTEVYREYAEGLEFGTVFYAEVLEVLADELITN